MSPSRARDAHRSAVYAAEDQVAAVLARGGTTHEVAGSTLTLPIERRFGDLDSIQRYADRVLSLTQITDRWPGLPPVRVRERAGSRRAHYERSRSGRDGVPGGVRDGAPGGVIAVPTDRDGRWAMREMVVLHEIAHHVAAYEARRRAGSDSSTSATATATATTTAATATATEPSHGPIFTAVFCTLTGIVIGPEIELMLRVAFDGVGVPVGVPTMDRGAG